MPEATPIREEETAGAGFDLLRFRWIRRLILSSRMPYVPQAILLLLLVLLTLVGWGRYPPDGVAGKLYAKANVVNLLIWGLWWPAMVWIAVAFGRIWCAVCPLEFLANGTERLGRRLGIKPWVLGRRLQSGALILVFYAAIQLLVAGVHLHRVPAYTSFYLAGLLIVAALVGLLWKDRAFCRGFCPVGLLLGTYGRGSMLAVRPTSSEACRNCLDKECTLPERRNRTDGRSCPSLLNPAKLTQSSDCLVCGQCIKTCGPENMGLFIRRPFHPADARERQASWTATLFVILVSGFVAYELCSEWPPAKAALLWVPMEGTKWLGLAAYDGWIRGIWLLFLFPVLIWSLLGAVVVRFRGAATIAEAWRRLALPLAVVIAGGHMAKALAKVASWGGYLPLVFSDPLGLETARAIAEGTAATPARLLPMWLVSTVATVLIVVMTAFAVRESRLADPSTHRTRLAVILSVGLAAAFLTFGWGAFV